jgi:acyl-coenzyme A thioesterase PaaI-like protein
MNWLAKLVSEQARATIALRLFGLTRIPMLAYVRPTVVEISMHRVVVRIPLRRRTRNHLGSMYFGALSVGADCAAGALAMHLIEQQPEPISLVFKDFNAEFLKRAEGDVEFCCRQGQEIAELVARAAASDERVERQVEVIATAPSLSDEPVAKFRLTLSLKYRT